MFKQAEITPTIKNWIAAAYGDPDVNTSDLAVFEAKAANTRPLRRRYGIHAGARIEPSTLNEMSKVIGQGETVPLHTMHNTDNAPAGRVFHAETRPDPEGGTVLHTMFYMSKRDGDLVDKVNKGIFNEVSVGLAPKEMRCSECGWNYLGEDASVDHLLECTCPDGHTVGKDGVHVRLHGLASWQELSLVDRGATKGALILPKSRQSLARTPDFERMAASGFDPNLFVLNAQCDFTPRPKGPPNMDELVNLKAEHIVLQRDHAAGVTELAAARLRITELEAKLAEAVKGDLVPLKAELAAVETFLTDYATAALSALGKPADALPATITEKLAVVTEAREKLALSLVAGGRAAPAAKGEPPEPAPDYSAFKTPLRGAAK